MKKKKTLDKKITYFSSSSLDNVSNAKLITPTASINISTSLTLKLCRVQILPLVEEFERDNGND